MFLDIFILHYKNFEALKQTIISLNHAYLALGDYTSTQAPIRISIFDNGNLPLEADQLKAWFEKEKLAWNHKLVLHRSVWNRGFSGGHNELWKRTRPKEWVLFLNSDIQVPPYFFKKLLEFLSTKNVQEKIIFVPQIEEGKLTYAGGKFLKSRATGRMSSGQSAPENWDFVSGAGLIVPAIPFAEAGLWNENFFFYGEDVELGVRLKQNSWQFQLIPGVVLTHQGKASFVTHKNMPNHEALRLHFRSRALLIKYCLTSPWKPWAILVVSLEVSLKCFLWIFSIPFKDFQIKKIQTTWRAWFLEGLPMIYKNL